LEESKWDFSKLKEAGTDESEVEDDFEGISSSEMRPRPGKPDHNPPPPKPDRQPKPKPKPRPNPKPQR
jgi:protein TonB